MDAKAYLGSIERMDRLIERKLDEASRTRDMMGKVTTAYGGTGGSGGGESDKVGACIARLVDLEAEIDEAVDKYVDIKRDAMQTVDKVRDPTLLALLYRRYIDRQTFEQCAYEMGFSYQWICELDKRAVAEVQKLLDN